MAISKQARKIINSVKPNLTNVPSGPTQKGSAGYDNVRDDIEKTKSLREGSMEKIPVNNNDIVNKEYCDNSKLELGMNFGGTTAASYFTDIIAQGITNARMWIPDYTNAGNQATAKTSVLLANANGLKTTWGTTSVDTTITTTTWPAFKAAILENAQWSQDNGVFEYQIGNEEELHVDNITITFAQLRDLMKEVATEVQAIFTNGNVTLASTKDEVDDWVTLGRGDIDIMTFNIYRGSVAPFTDAWKGFIDAAIAGFGAEHTHLSEFSLSSTSIESYSTDEEVQTVALAEMINYIKAAGMTKAYFFMYGLQDNFGARKASGAYRQLWDVLKIVDIPHTTISDIISTNIYGTEILTENLNATGDIEGEKITGTSLDINGVADISGTLDVYGDTLIDAELLIHPGATANIQTEYVEYDLGGAGFKVVMLKPLASFGARVMLQEGGLYLTQEFSNFTNLLFADAGNAANWQFRYTDATDRFCMQSTTTDNTWYIEDIDINLTDNHGVQFGTGIDATILFDGSDLIIKSNNITANDELHIEDFDKTLIDNTLEVNAKSKLTDIGGFAIKITNKTGANSVAGQLVKADTATNDAVILAAAGDVECIGVFLESGIADAAEAWVVVSGIADVALDDNVASVRGDWMSTGVLAGYAATATSPAAAPTHFEEIGHCIESVAAGGAGTHILARCVLHFN